LKSRRSVADAVHDAALRLDQAGVVFGHGTVDALQESTWIAAHVLGRAWNELVAASQAPIDSAAEAAIGELVARRIATRKPAAYLLNEAWLGPHRFYVDERVIVPRSFIAELLRADRPPGAHFGQPKSVLDLCTGSGCLAILAALAWPQAQVDAADQLVVEIGHNRKALERAFPGLPFAWPRTSAGRNFVFTLAVEALPPKMPAPGESAAESANRGKQGGRRD